MSRAGVLGVVEAKPCKKCKQLCFGEVVFLDTKEQKAKILQFIRELWIKGDERIEK